jgi:4-amino-4-deoxy-L-arabinose transferase-like glycosyltransferase
MKPSRRAATQIGLALVLLLAAALRFYRLDNLPPGLWFDEAWVSLQARDLPGQPAPPVYFAADFGGMHPATVYLTALFRWLSGGHPLAIRYAVATVSVVTIAMTFFTLRSIFQAGGEEPQSRTIGLVGVLILSMTFPYLLLSRIGFENVLPTLPAVIIFFFLARAVRARRLSTAYVWAGIALGASLYTYDSARFLPVAVTVALFWLALFTGARRRYLTGLIVVAVFALAVFLPLGIYFLQNWGQFTLRAGVSSYNTFGPGSASVPRALLANAGHTLAGLSLPGFGDELARHNLPGRPVFDPFLSLLFWLGVLVLARRPRDPRTALLFSWAGVMLLPAILTDGAPTYTRMLGAMPALAGIAAVGAGTLFRWLAVPRRERPRRLWLARGVLVAGLALSLGLTLSDYFGRWAGDPRLFDAFQVGDWQAAMLARERLAEGPVYVVPDLVTPARPTFDLLLRGSGVKVVGATGCLATFDRLDEPVTYLVDAGQGGDTLDRLEAAFAGQGQVETILQPASGETLFLAYSLPAGARALATAQPVAAAFGPLALLGYELEPAAPRAGETLTVRLTWQAQGTAPAGGTVFVHLYAPGEEEQPPAAQSDQAPCGGAYPTERWQPGEIIVTEQTLSVPAGFAAPAAVLAAGVYTWPSLERLPLVAETGALPGDRLRLAQVSISR